MGKGRIVSGGEDGSYTVELLHSRDRIEAEIASLAARLVELQEELNPLEVERSELVAERNAITTDIDTAIANTEEGEIPDVEALLIELAQVSAKIQQQDVRIAMIRGRILEATKRQQMLQAIPADPQQQAWCADFTEDLTGEVGTVELPGEAVVGEFATWRRVIIRPGFEGRADYLPARDGQLFHREGQVGYQAYFNAAILPGVQKWKPLHRIALVSTIDRDANTCTINIRSEDSSANSLQIDQGLTLANVPFEYMTCDHEAFEVGDLVLVEFINQDWNSPKVIGFEKEPQPCLPDYILMRTRAYLPEERVSIPRWNLEETELVVPVFGATSGLLFRTKNVPNALSSITWEMPPDYPDPNGFHGLFVEWLNASLFWNEAEFFNGAVSVEDRKDYTVPLPDEMAGNELMVFNMETGINDRDEALSAIQEDGSNNWIRTVKISSLFLPTTALDDLEPYTPVTGGSTNLYRFTVDAYVGDWTAATLAQKRIRGSYKLEVIDNDEVPSLVLLESHDPIPDTLTIQGTIYNRYKIGKTDRARWAVDGDGNPVSTDKREIAVLWQKNGAEVPTFPEGFWKEDIGS